MQPAKFECNVTTAIHSGPTTDRHDGAFGQTARPACTPRKHGV
jgi:hypothetical protein